MGLRDGWPAQRFEAGGRVPALEAWGGGGGGGEARFDDLPLFAGGGAFAQEAGGGSAPPRGGLNAAAGNPIRPHD